MIKGMARAGRVFGRSEWVESARRSAEFVRSTLWKNGRLLATYKDGRAHLNAYLDDYAFLLDSLLELLQTDFRSDDLEWASALAGALIEHFEDRAAGGFYFTSHDHEKLIQRPKSAHDGATPSGNGVAAYALQRLGHLIGEARYLEAAERTLRALGPAASQAPSAHTSLLTALEEALAPPRLVVLRGPDEGLREWHAALAADLRPDTMIVAVPAAALDLPPPLAHAPPSAPAAWLCEGAACRPPVFSLDALRTSLDAR